MFNRIKEFLFPETKGKQTATGSNSTNTTSHQPQQPAPKEPTPLGLILLNTLLPTLCAVAYILIGVFMKIWHPTWLIFFVIPIYYTMMEAIERKNITYFGFPFLAIGVYLLLGFIEPNYFKTCWVLILTIPLYYFICAAIKKKNLTWLFNCIVPVACIAAYLLLGFLGGYWHPGWVVFFAIPLYYQTVAAVKKYKKERKDADYYASGNNDYSKVETMTAEEYERRKNNDHRF